MANYLAGKDRQDLDHASIFRFCILFQIIASKGKEEPFVGNLKGKIQISLYV